MCEKFYQIRSFEKQWIWTSDTSISQKVKFSQISFHQMHSFDKPWICTMSHNRIHTLWLLALQVKWYPTVLPFVPFVSWHVAKFYVICKVENTFTFCEMTSNSVSVSELTPQVSLYLQSGKHFHFLFHFLWNDVQQCFSFKVDFPSFTFRAKWKSDFEAE